MHPDFPPGARHGKRLRWPLQWHDEHYARALADREASSVAPLADDYKRIVGEWKLREACSLGAHSVADIALEGASLPAVKLRS
jgi:hypothetical protein